MKKLFTVLLALCLLCASALAEGVTTNGGVEIVLEELRSQDGEA